MKKGLTVKQLMEYCKEQVDRGNGDKYILISEDYEGNWYHILFDGFTTDIDTLEAVIELECYDDYSANEIVILG